MIRRGTVLAMFCAGALHALPAAAQNPVFAPDTMLIADTVPQEFPSPRGAFMRAVLVPGWGHFHTGSYTRGAVYLTLQTTSWFMLGKTIMRLNDVQDRDELLTRLAADSLEAAMAADPALAEQLQNPQAYDAALLTYPGLRNARGLVNARRQQRQDWITYTLFFTFAAGVDAYVTAHLKDFPADIMAEPGRDGRMNLGLQFPVGRRY